MDEKIGNYTTTVNYNELMFKWVLLLNWQDLLTTTDRYGDDNVNMVILMI